ncbi:hypothetical protein [Streptomyces sp. BBFR102]|uniref:hypothetical protein n=1 Tax=Streptomyces sp. BBFR102 TaxID=3448171 RepID=UPI003F5395FE
MDPVKMAHHPADGGVSSYWSPAQRPISSTLNQEHAMADLAFVATTIAIFALVALVARGVTRI